MLQRVHDEQVASGEGGAALGAGVLSLHGAAGLRRRCLDLRLSTLSGRNGRLGGSGGVTHLHAAGGGGEFWLRPHCCCRWLIFSWTRHWMLGRSASLSRPRTHLEKQTNKNTQFAWLALFAKYFLIYFIRGK